MVFITKVESVYCAVRTESSYDTNTFRPFCVGKNAQSSARPLQTKMKRNACLVATGVVDLQISPLCSAFRIQYSQSHYQQYRFINNSSQLNMFREIILPIFRSTRLCVTACGIMHRRCCIIDINNIDNQLDATITAY